MIESAGNRLVCKMCGATYALHVQKWKCDCGSVLDLDLKPRFDLGKITGRKPTMWRYREAIPIYQDADIVSFDEGFTPLIQVDFDGHAVWVKQDQLFSTGSYKDRGASVLISQVRALGIDRVVEDSSGNAGCAIAAYCARAGITCDIYVPASTSPAKIAQIEAYGARLIKVPGSREDTARAVLAAAETTYYASHSWNPFFFQGTKCFAFEVCEQLGWRAPDAVVLPAGNGTLVLGAFLGFQELANAGLIAKIPRIVAVQAENCAPLYRAYANELAEPCPIDKQATVAEGIAIATPIRGSQILQAVRESGGQFVTASETEIRASLQAMWHKGFYIEPTSAATTAGVSKLIPQLDPGWVIVSVFTGHGLKSAGH
ncbi:MAG: threonine synthase [Anaerolineae bacterium]|nr:threonine synthase [Anaerolineae bacterium]